MIELDPTVEVAPNGALIVSDIIQDHYVARSYYGYKLTEAVALFLQEFMSDFENSNELSS